MNTCQALYKNPKVASPGFFHVCCQSVFPSPFLLKYTVATSRLTDFPRPGGSRLGRQRLQEAHRLPRGGPRHRGHAAALPRRREQGDRNPAGPSQGSHVVHPGGGPKHGTCLRFFEGWSAINKYLDFLLMTFFFLKQILYIFCHLASLISIYGLQLDMTMAGPELDLCSHVEGENKPVFFVEVPGKLQFCLQFLKMLIEFD